MHALTSLAELERRSSAFDTVVAARDERLCGFIGVTGHDMETPRAPAEAVRRFDLDTVMFPISPRLWCDGDYRRDAETRLALATERDLDVMIIKAVSARPWIQNPPPRHSTTWYEPYQLDSEIKRGVCFALSVDGVHGFCTPGDVALLPRVIAAAKQFQSIDSEAAMAACATSR